MTVVADSGSTKTEWALVKDPGNIVLFRTAGYNPYFNQQVSWSKEVADRLSREGVDRIYYYGAGCDVDNHRNRVKNALLGIFPSAKITVEDDLTGAARSLFGTKRGVTLILGTGTNVGLWNGETLIKRNLPLGYLLGDHGSGAVLGLRLVKAWLDRELTPQVSKAFENQYKVNIPVLKNEIYLKGKPNYYLAGFSPFLGKHQTDKTIYSILESEFGKLFDIQIKPLLSSPDDKIRATGSVAYYFQDILRTIAGKRGMEIDKIVRYPLKDLVGFHLKHMET